MDYNTTKKIIDASIAAAIENIIPSVADKVADKILDSMHREQEKLDSAAWKRKVAETREAFKTYRAMKMSVEEEEEVMEDEISELRFQLVADLMEGRNRTEQSMFQNAKTREQKLLSLMKFEKALAVCEADLEVSGSEAEQRAIRVAKMMHINEVPLSVAEIAELEQEGERAVYKDFNKACELMAGYLVAVF